MQIAVQKLSERELKPLYKDPAGLGFGKVFTRLHVYYETSDR